MQAGSLRVEPGPIQRHNHSRSIHEVHSANSQRRPSYAKSEIITTVQSLGGTSAALKAAKLSSAQYAPVPVRHIATPSPVKPERNPYLAAASKAWSNSTAKLLETAPVSRSSSAAPATVSSGHPSTANLAYSHTPASHGQSASKSPAVTPQQRVSTDLSEAEELAPALAPIQAPLLLPSVFLHPDVLQAPRGDRMSRSVSSDQPVRVRSQSAYEGRRSSSRHAADTLPSESLKAARISFAQDRALHDASTDSAQDRISLSTPPPLRPSSANRSRAPSQQHALYAQFPFSRSTGSLLPIDRRALSTSPNLTASNSGTTRLSVDGGRAALMAASLSFAHHELENPRPSTPKIEPYSYVTHSQRITLRKEPTQSAKHWAKFLKHGRVQPIPPQDRKRYEGLWAANKGLLMEDMPRYSEEVVNVVVRDIWSRSRLQSEILAQVWQLVDREAKGRLSKDEFVVGTWLIDHRLRGRKLPHRQELTDDIFAPGPMTRLNLKVPKKLKHDTAKYLDPSVSRKSEKKALKKAVKKLKKEKRAGAD